MTVNGVLQQAAKLVEKGWCQNALQNGRGYCVMGAIQAAIQRGVKDPEQRQRLFLLTHARLQKVLPYGASVVNFNDAKGRKKADILKLLRDARD